MTEFRLISLAIGYLFGNILTAEITARKCAGKSAFEIGSGNPGMANIMAQCGFRPGIVVLIGDLLKTVIPCLLCSLLLFPENRALAAAYAGSGAILGHNYPVWHRFKGGKGVSSTCAVLFCIYPAGGIIAMLIGMLGVFISQYLPVGGVLIPLAFIPFAYYQYGTEMALLAAAMTLVMLIRHIPGFRGIRTGAEKKHNIPGLIKNKLFRKENSDKENKTNEEKNGTVNVEKSSTQNGEKERQG